jgi:hypothetical protein
MSGILSGNNQPSDRLVHTFSVALGVTVDYLLKGGKRQQLVTGNAVDAHILPIYRRLTPEGQKLLEYLARAIARAEKSGENFTRKL